MNRGRKRRRSKWSHKNDSRERESERAFVFCPEIEVAACNKWPPSPRNYLNDISRHHFPFLVSVRCHIFLAFSCSGNPSIIRQKKERAENHNNKIKKHNDLRGKGTIIEDSLAIQVQDLLHWQFPWRTRALKRIEFAYSWAKIILFKLRIGMNYF